MTHWYHFSIVIGPVPASERSVVTASFGADLVFDGAPDSRPLVRPGVEEWSAHLTEREISEKLRDGLMRYRAQFEG